MAPLYIGGAQMAVDKSATQVEHHLVRTAFACQEVHAHQAQYATVGQHIIQKEDFALMDGDATAI